MALLEKIYTDKDIPGTITLPNRWNGNGAVNGVNEVLYYSPSKSESERHWWIGGWVLPTTVDIYKPNEDGLTTLMVEVKDDYVSPNAVYTSVYDEIADSYKSVQLLWGATEVGSGADRKTVYTVQGDFNRFFFISKGSLREGSNLNGDLLFEEYCPTVGLGGTSEDITDYYSEMLQGKSYNILHDCTSVTYLAHYFSMSGQAGNESRQANLVFSVPDSRLTYWYQSAYRGGARDYGRNDKYVYYNPQYYPTTQLYTVALTAEAEANTALEHTYDVTVDWTNCVGGTESLLGENWELWIVDDAGVPTTLLTTSDGVQTHSYQEPQLEGSRTIGYMVKSTTSGGMVVWSNVGTVYIPGYNMAGDFKLDASIMGSHSWGDVANSYINKVVVTNAIGNEFAYERDDATSMALVLTRTSAQGTPENVANLALALAGSKWNWTITPSGASSTVDPATGSVNASNGSVDFGTGIVFTDRPTANTSDNSHPDHYTYQLVAADNDDVATNEATVTVPKTELLIGNLYTASELAADDASYPVLPTIDSVRIDVAIPYNPNVLYYNVMCGDSKKAYAQLADDGYALYVLGADGTWTNCGAIDVTGTAGQQTASFTLPKGDDASNAPWWVEIVRFNTGSYGANQESFPNADVTAEVTYSSTRAAVEGKLDLLRSVRADYFVNVLDDITLDAPESGIGGYRVWRQAGEDQEWVQDDLAEAWSNTSDKANNQDKGWNWIDVKQDLVSIAHNDVFASPTASEEAPLAVRYIVRKYLKVSPNNGGSRAMDGGVIAAPGMAPEDSQADEPRIYYIVQDTLLVNFTGNTTTGVTDVAPVQSHAVTVWNVAGVQVYSGHESGLANLPAGLWIVRRANGETIKVRK